MCDLNVLCIVNHSTGALDPSTIIKSTNSSMHLTPSIEHLVDIRKKINGRRKKARCLQCHGSTSYYCIACEVALCPSTCFRIAHEQTEGFVSRPYSKKVKAS